jgi:aromatic ring-opening dioxygenase catalytic subunit (LigB family)
VFHSPHFRRKTKEEKRKQQRGVLVHDYNPITQQLRQESYEFDASLGYMIDPVSKKQKQKRK